jgi:hypothetical protein
MIWVKKKKNILIFNQKLKFFIHAFPFCFDENMVFLWEMFFS